MKTSSVIPFLIHTFSSVFFIIKTSLNEFDLVVYQPYKHIIGGFIDTMVACCATNLHNRAGFGQRQRVPRLFHKYYNCPF